jgi:sec-independent protein translocase protein TatB
MGSVGTGEILVIALVALIVFGPHRLPEIARKAGELLSKAREMTQSFTDSIDAEYGEMASPIKELKGEYDATMTSVKGIASSITDMTVELPNVDLKADEVPDKDPDKADTKDASETPPPPDEAQ